MSDPLDHGTLEAVLPGRPLRVYPAVLSTEADAMAWARQGAPDGAVVAADYQAAPRGRGGMEWELDPERGLAFSMVLRPDLTPDQEGWLYTIGTVALSDVLGAGGAIEWPDHVLVDGEIAGGIGVQTGGDEQRLHWAVLTFLAVRPPPPRAEVIAEVVDAVDSRRHEDPATVLAVHEDRLATLGRRVRARLMPVGPAGPEFTGEAVGSKPDGALVLATGGGPRVAVQPQILGRIEEPEDVSEPDLTRWTR